MAAKNAAQTLTVEHPTGSASVIGAAAVIIANKFGADLTTEEGVTIVGAIALIVSYFTPRFGHVDAADVDDPATGPDAT